MDKKFAYEEEVKNDSEAELKKLNSSESGIGPRFRNNIRRASANRDDRNDNQSVALANLNEEAHESSSKELCDLILFYLKIFFPTTMIFLTRFIQQMVNVSYIGQTFEDHHMIDALGLAHLYTNVLLFSFCIVVAYAFDFLGPRAYGAKNYEMFGIYIHRTVILMYAIFLILYLIHFFSASKLMLELGMDVKQYEHFDVYMKIFQLSYIFEFPHVIMVRFLNLVGKPYISVIVMFCATSFHFGFCHLFVRVAGMGVKGAALASICTQFINIAGEMFYTLVFKPLPEAIFFFRRESFEDLWEFMKVYFPLLPIGMSGLWSQEIEMFIAFSVSNIDLAAHVVLQTISNIFLGFSFGNSFTAVIIVGFYIGKKDLTKIRKILYISSVSATFLIGILTIFLYVFRQNIVLMFLSKEDVLQKVLPCIPFLCVYQILEINNRTYYNWFRAIGRKLISIIIPLITYFVVMITISLLLTKVAQMGVYGIWLSNICAEAFSIGVLVILYFCVIDVEDSCIELINTYKKEDVKLEAKSEVKDEEKIGLKSGEEEDEDNEETRLTKDGNLDTSVVKKVQKDT